jgi:hypothetical protein
MRKDPVLVVPFLGYIISLFVTRVQGPFTASLLSFWCTLNIFDPSLKRYLILIEGSSTIEIDLFVAKLC